MSCELAAAQTVSREFLDALAKIGNPPTLLDDVCVNAEDFKGFVRYVEKNATSRSNRLPVRDAPHLSARQIRPRVVDEAGQLDEPATLAPLALAPKFVLGGDHLQLPPVVKASSNESDATKNSDWNVHYSSGSS